MKVDVKIINLNETINIFADDIEKKIVLNGLPVDFDPVKFVSEVSVITYNWEENNINNSIIDGERYAISIISNNNKQRKIMGKNNFPFNYKDLVKLLNEVKGNGN